MPLAELIKTIREEIPVIRQAPLTICLSVLLLTSLAAGLIYLAFKENLTRKDDLIKTLQQQLDSKIKVPESSKPQPDGKTGDATYVRRQ
jgi:hypothetical protein